MTNSFERVSGTASIDEWQDYHTRMAQYERDMVQYRKDIARYNRRKNGKIASIILPVVVVCASTLVLARNNQETVVAAPDSVTEQTELPELPEEPVITRESTTEAVITDGFEQLNLFWDNYFIEKTGEPLDDPELVSETKPEDLCYEAVDTARYCIRTSEIIMPVGDIISLSDYYSYKYSAPPADTVTALAVVAHEYGHHAQFTGLRDLTEGRISTITDAQGEALADCLAGASIASIYGTETAYRAAQFMQTVGDDYTDSPHDTPTARQMYVEAGAIGGVDQCIELVGA